MGWKDDLIHCERRTDSIDQRLIRMEKKQFEMHMKLDGVYQLMQGQLSKMADRVLEAAMIQQGGFQDAVKHRNISRMDGRTPDPGPDELWDDPEIWPPEGSLEIKTP